MAFSRTVHSPTICRHRFALPLPLLVLLVTVACSSAGMRLQPPAPKATPPVEVYRIDTGLANVYLIKGTKLIMVDASGKDKLPMLLENIRKLGLEPADVELIVVTHGHADHAGNARFFQKEYGTKVAGGKGDTDKFTRGRTDLSKAESIGLTARLIRSMSDAPYDPWTPDVSVSSEVSLAEYGIPGAILPLPGHTPGSLIVRVGNMLFVGDLIRGGIFFEKSPTEHFFHEDRALARRQLRTVLQSDVKMIFPGHFGPLSADDVRDWLGEEGR